MTKKIFPTLLIAVLLLSTNLAGQSLSDHLPSTTVFALSINGSNLQEKMSIESFEALDFYQEIRKELEREGLSGELKNLGVDFSKEHTFFAIAEENCIIMGGIIPINNSASIEKLVGESNFENINGIKVKYDSFSTIGISDQYFIFSTAQSTSSYPRWDATEEQRMAYEKIQEEKETFHQNFFINLFSENSSPLSNNSNYKKSYDSKADANIYISVNATLAEYYANSMNAGGLILNATTGGMQSILSNFSSEDQFWGGQLYFNEDQISIESHYFPGKESMKTQKALAKSKIDPELLKYISQDDLLGLYSINLNMEAALESAPDGMAPILGSFLPMVDNAGGKIASLFSTIIDEEEIAALINGKGIISVSNLSQKEISYTTYEYDDDFNSIEKTEKGTELLPDVLGMLSTSKPNDLNSILEFLSIDSPLEKKEDYFFLPSSRDVIFPIYIFTMSNALIITNSKEQMKIIRSEKGYGTIQKSLAKSLLKNSQNVHVNLAQIFKNIPQSSNPDRFENKALGYLSEHTRTVQVHQFKPKGKSVSTELILEVPGTGHENGLKYLFNIINDLYKISEN